jgi:hypothetical protein
MSQHPDVGACGGFNEPVYEISPPHWFELVKRAMRLGHRRKLAILLEEEFSMGRWSEHTRIGMATTGEQTI